MSDLFGNPEDRFSRVAAHITAIANLALKGGKDSLHGARKYNASLTGMSFCKPSRD